MLAMDRSAALEDGASENVKSQVEILGIAFDMPVLLVDFDGISKLEFDFFDVLIAQRTLHSDITFLSTLEFKNFKNPFSIGEAYNTLDNKCQQGLPPKIPPETQRPLAAPSNTLTSHDLQFQHPES